MTRIDEVSRDLYRISTPVPVEQIPGGFSFNQYLLVDDEPLLRQLMGAALEGCGVALSGM